jgi:iron complex outermembrane receptor protein
MSLRKNLSKAVGLGALAFAVSLPGIAVAQDDDGTVDTIIVTAQRTEQSLQDVPNAVTAITQENIENRQVADVTDIQYLVPNISLAAGTGTANSARIFLRGVGEDESRGAVDPAVGIYVDGVYIGRQVGGLFDVVDLAQIEVLRGPQGTLYGRNSVGGAIKLTSVKPQFENAGRLGLTVGSQARLDVRGMANFEINENTAIRLSAINRTRDGFHNIKPNGSRSGEDIQVGALDTTALRAQFRHDFNDDWSLNLAYDRTDDDSDAIPGSFDPSIDADGDLFSIEPFPGVDCDASATAVGCYDDFSQSLTSQGFTGSLEGKLFGLNFQSLTGYRQLDDELNSRIGLVFDQATDQNQFSQEFTFSSNYEGPLNWVGGVYYFTEEVTLDTVFVFPFQVKVDTESVAVFGQATFEATDRLNLTAGVRYTDEEKELDAERGDSFIPGDGREETASFENTSFTLSADYQFTDAVMGYASYRTGFKSGGWSPDCFGATACFLPVTEETLDSIELGIRSDLLDDRLRLNATYFFNTYDDLQIAGTVPGLGFTRFNVAETEISGFELESQFRITPNFELFGNLGLLDAEYKSLTTGQANALTINGASQACTAGQSVEQCALGLELKNAPEYKGQIGFNYTPTIAAGDVLITADANFEDDSFSLVANSPAQAITDPGVIFNARLRYSPFDSNWNLALWGKNLTDEQYYRASTSENGLPGGPFASGYASEPLTVGVDFNVNF